jgi:hypothetical protein
MSHLVYRSSPLIHFATNTFVNVPVILQYEDAPLLEVIHEENAGYAAEFKIYHKDGTYLAKVRGAPSFPLG